MSLITYPVEVKQYKVEVTKEGALIWLRGVEHLLGSVGADAQIKHAGRIEFALDDSGDREDFIDRGGGLYMNRSMKVLSCIVDLLRNERPLYLSRQGMLSTSPEPVGEDEDL